MNFDWKLLLSEVEILQLAPLEHLRYQRNTQPSGLLTQKHVSHESPHCLFHCKLRNVLKKEKVEEKNKEMKDVSEKQESERELQEEEEKRTLSKALWLSPDQCCPQLIPSLNDFTWKKDSVRGGRRLSFLCYSFFSVFSVLFTDHQFLFKCNVSQLGEKVFPETYSTPCVS